MGTATANTELLWSVMEFVTEQHSRLMGVTIELVKWKASDITHDMGLSWGSSKRLVGGRDGLCARTAFLIGDILAMQIKYDCIPRHADGQDCAQHWCPRSPH